MKPRDYALFLILAVIYFFSRSPAKAPAIATAYTIVETVWTETGLPYKAPLLPEAMADCYQDRGQIVERTYLRVQSETGSHRLLLATKMLGPTNRYYAVTTGREYFTP